MGFPIWNVFEIQLYVCVLYWKMYGFAEAIIFHMEKNNWVRVEIAKQNKS